MRRRENYALATDVENYLDELASDPENASLHDAALWLADQIKIERTKKVAPRVHKR